MVDVADMMKIDVMEKMLDMMIPVVVEAVVGLGKTGFQDYNYCLLKKI